MRVNNKQDDPLRLHQENIKEVDKFVYLGSVVSKDGEVGGRGGGGGVQTKISSAE